MNCSLPFPKPDAETAFGTKSGRLTISKHVALNIFERKWSIFTGTGLGAQVPAFEHLCERRGKLKSLPVVSRGTTKQTTNTWKAMSTTNANTKVVNAIINQMTEFDQRSFGPEQKTLRGFESSTANSSRGFDQGTTATTFSWSDRDFDRPCAMSSPLNEW
jgi:hypothetical protein